MRGIWMSRAQHCNGVVAMEYRNTKNKWICTFHIFSGHGDLVLLARPVCILMGKTLAWGAVVGYPDHLDQLVERRKGKSWVIQRRVVSPRNPKIEAFGCGELADLSQQRNDACSTRA